LKLKHRQEIGFDVIIFKKHKQENYLFSKEKTLKNYINKDKKILKNQ